MLAAGSPQAANFSFVTIGSPGNLPDGTIMDDMTTGYGAVSYSFRFARYEVTNEQYAEFLNAVAATDPTGLYNPYMDSAEMGGITRTGTDGSYEYVVKPDRGNKPVIEVSWWDVLRFVNWLENGQPVGGQDETTTEDGTYTFCGVQCAGPRNEGATYFLPSEDEWHKAAYYDPVLDGWWEFPTGTDDITTCDLPPGGSNSANCAPFHVSAPDIPGIVMDVTDVGSYPLATGPSGAFDVAGNVYEWTEGAEDNLRIRRGGGWDDGRGDMSSMRRKKHISYQSKHNTGFRIAAAPEPGQLASELVAIASLGSISGAIRRRRSV